MWIEGGLEGNLTPYFAAWRLCVSHCLGLLDFLLLAVPSSSPHAMHPDGFPGQRSFTSFYLTGPQEELDAESISRPHAMGSQ